MSYLKNSLLMGVLFITGLQATDLTTALVLRDGKQEHKTVFGQLFESKQNADYYWEALAQVANNNTQVALDIIQALHSNKPLPYFASVKDNYLNNIDALFDYLFLKFISQDPQTLSYLGLFESIGVREHNAYLNDISPDFMLHNFGEMKKCLDLLGKYNSVSLSQEQKLSYQIFLWLFRHVVAGQKFMFHEYKVNQMFGILSDLSMTLVQFHSLESSEDAEYYIARLNRIPKQFQQTIELLEYQKKLGIIPPMFTIQKVINIIQKTIPSNVTECVFYSTFAERIKHIQGVDNGLLLERVKLALQNHVYPAYMQLKEYCTRLLDTATANNGVWALPDGDEYYAYILRYHTTTDLSPDQIYELGLEEVDRIHKEIREIFASEGFVVSDKKIGELFQEISKDPRFFYPDTAEGRQQCLDQFEAILQRCQKELYPLFDLKPKVSVKIQPVPSYEEESQAGAYYCSPSIDGSRPGLFFVNLRSMQELPIYRMETLAMHEAEPGHHFQIAVQNDMNLPMLRNLTHNTAFVEGWALYAEKLAYEQGFYSSSFAKLGHLQDELLRAARLVVDTGIHKKRWTREQAIDYMTAATGMNRESVATEVERYFVLPGQACSYKIGQLKILELRQRAKDLLGDNFSIQEFHNLILKTGSCPLAVLEEVVDQYIHEKQRA